MLRTPRTVVTSAAAAAVCAGLVGTPGTAAAGSDLTVTGGSMTVRVARTGGIDAITFADGRTWQLGGRSLLTEGTDPGSADSCSPDGTATTTDDRGARWQTTCTDSAGHTTTLTERLTPTDSSVAWTLQVAAARGTYAKGIWTRLTGWTDDHTRLFWTTWGQSPYVHGQNPTWSDPLRSAPFTDLVLDYGQLPGFSVPIATIVEPDTDHGLSLVQSPRDVLLDARIATTESGDVQLGRFNNRITTTKPVTFHMDLVATAADWRPGLGWMAGHYPDYFDSTTPDAADLAGLGTYSPYPGPFSDGLRAKLRAQDYRTNWELSLRGPYMGLFMPPVSSAHEEFPSFLNDFWPGAPATESVDDWQRILDYWNDAGLQNLAYFNTTEFGAQIEDPPPPQQYECDDPERWRNANDMLRCDFPDAVLRDADGSPTFSWMGAVVMDPGDPAYRRHLLEQARQLLTRLPQYRGVNIDRLDWLKRYNVHADDGVSWYDGAPARSLITSWKQLQPKLQAIIHGMGKQVWVSPTGSNKRIDWLKGIDGVFSEHDRGGQWTNLDAFLGLGRPVLGWNYDLGSDPDAFVQRYLYMGVFPMADAPENQHGMPMSATVERYYRDYAPMFRALRGKGWVYEPHAVQVTDGSALANVYTVDDGVVVPVVMGGDSSHAGITLHGLQQVEPGLDLSTARYIQPGRSDWQPLALTRTDGGLRADVPLARGAAMVRIDTYRAEAGAPPSASGRSLTLDLTSSRPSATPARPAVVTATAHNTTGHTLTDVGASIDVPADWTAERLEAPSATIGPNGSTSVRWRVAPPDGTTATVGDIRPTLTYHDQERAGSVSDSVRLTAGELVPQDEITATASSASPDDPAGNAVDGDDQTMWRSSSADELPSITLDLHRGYDLSGLTYLPQQDGALGGALSDYRVSVSADGTDFTTVTDGSWRYDAGLRAATFAAHDVRYVRLESRRVTCSSGSTAAAEINLVTAPTGGSDRDDQTDVTSTGDPAGTLPEFTHLVPHSAMTATATSHHPGYEASKAIDDDPYCTMWHSEWSPTHAPLPQSITLDLGRAYDTTALLYQQRRDYSRNGNITRYEISTSLDGDSFAPVAQGQWAAAPDPVDPRYAEWDPVRARYVRLTAVDGFADLASAADIEIAYESSAGLSVAAPDLFPAGQARSVSVTLTPDGQAALTGVELRLAAPDGWTATPAGPTSWPTVQPGEQVTGTWTVTPPAATAPGAYDLTARATFSTPTRQYDISQPATAQVPPPPPTGTAYLSDLDWTEATNGYGEIRRDENYYGDPLQIGGTQYEKGLWTNPPASITYYLGGSCTRFNADVGVDDSMDRYQRGSVTFQVWADDTKVWDSGLITWSMPASTADVDLTGAQTLRLVVTDGGDNKDYDHADWGSARITC